MGTEIISFQGGKYESLKRFEGLREKRKRGGFPSTDYRAPFEGGARTSFILRSEKVLEKEKASGGGAFRRGPQEEASRFEMGLRKNSGAFPLHVKSG